MQLYALHDRQLERVVEWYTSLEGARRELEALLRDEPDLVGQLEIVRIGVGAAHRVEPRARRVTASRDEGPLSGRPR